MNDPFAARLRQAAVSMLPVGAFLRRDRGAALFITDAPRRGVMPDWAKAGFLCESRGGLAFLTPASVWLDMLAAQYPEPPDDFCAAFQRFIGVPDAAVLKLFVMGMKQLDGAPHDPAFERKLRQAAAIALREHRSGGGLYACALLKFRITKKECAI